VAVGGAAAAVFFGRGTIAAKLIPQPLAAAPEKRMWRTIGMSFVVMIVSIVATATPKWTIGSSFYSGPWSMCPASGTCYDPMSVTSGFAAVYAVRAFTLINVFAAMFALLLPVLCFYGRMDSLMAAKIQTGLYVWILVASFAAMMLWTCIMLNGNAMGGALVCDIVVIVLSFVGCMLSYVWWKAIEVAPKDVSGAAVSGPMGTSSPSSSSGIKPPPVAYPTAHAAVSTPVAAVAVSTGGKPAYPTASAAAKPKAPASKEKLKWGDWEEVWDEENQAFYFFNTGTGDSLWEPPPGWPHAQR